MTTQSDAILQLLRRGKLDALLGEGAARGQVLFVRAARSDDRAQRRIERLQREVDELRSFLRTTVHELARPLEALERETAAVADLVERRNAPLWLLDPLRTFRQAARRMRGLLDDLDELGRIGADAEQRSPVDLMDLVGETVSEMSDVVRRSRVEFAVVGTLPTVYGRPRRLRILFENLLDNALRYAARSTRGRVEAGADDDDDQRIVWIRDNGPGFDPREAEAVFEPYVRLEPSSTCCGLGLTIAREVAAAEGAHVWLESEPGVGTTAYVAFPPQSLRETA